jgi:hypothetical protein
MKILQNKLTGTQTSFWSNFGGKLSSYLSFFLSTSTGAAAVDSGLILGF